MATNNPLTWLKKLREVFGMKTLIMLIIYQWVNKGYVFQGVLASMMQFYFGGVYRISGARLDIATTIVRMPYSLKPLIAIVSDAMPINGFYKKYYILFSSIIGTASLAVIALVPGSVLPVGVAIVLYFVATLQTAIIDILSEGAYAAEMRTHAEHGPDLVSFVWIGNYITITIGSIVSGPMIDALNKSPSGITGVQWMLATAIPFAALSIFAAYKNLLGEVQATTEEMKVRREKLWDQRELVFLSFMLGAFGIMYSFLGMVMSELGGAILISIFLVVAILSIWFLLRPVIGRYAIWAGIANCFALMSVAGPSYYFYMDTPEQYPDGPHFSAFFYNSVLSTCGNIFGMVALAAYTKFMGGWTFRFVLGVTIPIFTLMNSMNIIIFARWNVAWGINDHIFMFGDNALGQAAVALLQQPGFILISRVCPKKLEATTYALLAGLANFGMQVQGPLDAAITHALGITPNGSKNEGHKFDNMWIASIIVNSLHFIPLLFLWCVPNVPQNQNLMKEGDDDSATKDSPFRRLQARKSLESEVTDVKPVSTL